MNSNAWKRFGNVVNVLAIVQNLKGALEYISSKIKTAQGTLDEVNKVLDRCDSLLKQITVTDPLLGKVIEKQHPGSIEAFEDKLRATRSDHRSFEEMILTSSWKQTDLPRSGLTLSIDGLKNSVHDLYYNNLHTSNLVRNESVYVEMYDIFYRKPRVLTESEMDLELDKVYQRCQLRSGRSDVRIPIGTDGPQANALLSADASESGIPGSDAISVLDMPGAFNI